MIVFYFAVTFSTQYDLPLVVVAGSVSSDFKANVKCSQRLTINGGTRCIIIVYYNLTARLTDRKELYKFLSLCEQLALSMFTRNVLISLLQFTVVINVETLSELQKGQPL